jgi:hypothetical protein
MNTLKRSPSAHNRNDSDTPVNSPISRKNPSPANSPVERKNPSPAQSEIHKKLSTNNYNQEDFSDIDVDAENRTPSIRREKQEILFQLLKEYPSEAQGQWSLSIPLFELKYELSRRQKFQEEIDQLCMMKQCLKMILIAIETANTKFGPFLELKGWSKSITRDMSKYDKSLKAIYRRYFRRKTTHPVYELAWLIIGSAVMWHLECKCTGETPDDMTGMHDIQPPPGAKVPFENPGKSKPAGGFNIGSLLKLFM